MRHGKSSWDQPQLRDFDRPLAQRGLRQAPQMAKRLRKRGVIPDVVVSSPAARAWSTAQIYARELGLDDSRLHSDKRIYAASWPSLLEIVQELHDSWDCVMLVGHNPGFNGLADRLVDGAPDNIPTSAYAEISLGVDSWLEVREGCGRRLVFDYPKNREPV